MAFRGNCKTPFSAKSALFSLGSIFYKVPMAKKICHFAKNRTNEKIIKFCARSELCNPLFKIILSLICLVCVERFCYRQTKGFRLPKATTAHIYPFTSPIQPAPEYLFQSFYFLDSGVQFYVFIGEDQKTVLKLFKHHHTGPSYELLNLFPERLIKPILHKRERRMCSLLKSVALAQARLADETGILYTHLEKSKGALGNITLYSPLGIKHTLNLDQTEFVLQKRVDPTVKRLYKLFSNRKVDEAITCMKSLLTLVEARSSSGVKNKDKRLLQNTGFFEDKPIDVDLGSFALLKPHDHPDRSLKERKRMILQLIKWVDQNYPEYVQEVKANL